MGLSKEQVERHIAGVEKRLGSAQERAHHGYEFARLCVEVDKNQEAIRYLTDYLSVQEKDFRAHKLMGQVCDKEGDLEKAIVHYNRSLQLKPDQREVATSAAKLYCKMDNPPAEALKMCLERIKPFSSAHSLILAINEKLLSMEGSEDPDAVVKLVEQQLALCKDDITTHIRLINHYSSTGAVSKALTYCLAQRKKQLFTKNREWLTCVIQLAEQMYVSVKSDTPYDHVTQCHLLYTVLDHLSLLFDASVSSGSLMVSVLLKYDKVLFAALQALRSQQPHVSSVQRVALRELCGQYYLLVASYMYWCNKFRSTLSGKQTLKHSQVGDLCLLASLSFPPPNLNTIPLPKELQLRQEVEDWHARACKRLCVVARQLLLVSKQKGDIYLGGLTRIVEGQGGKLAIIRALFTENEDLRGVNVQFASSIITYNIRSSYLAAESEHLLAQDAATHLPSESEAQLCDRVYIQHSADDLSSLLWLCLCLRAVKSSAPVFSWLTDIFQGLSVDQQSSHLRHAAADTLSLCDVEAVLVLSINGVQISLTSPPSQPSSLPESLLRHLPVTMTTILDSADVVKYRQWWSCVHQWLSNTVREDVSGVKQTISEGLSHARGCRPLRLSLQQLASLAQHFQQRAETMVDAGGDQTRPVDSPLIQGLLKRSSHYWEIVVDILTDRDSYRDASKYRNSQTLTPKREDKGKILLTPRKTRDDPDKISLLNEARMALGDAAAFKWDISQALGLYSRVKTAQAAWNQAQIYLMLAKQGSPDKASEKLEHLEKTAETLELALARLTPTEAEFRERIEEKQEEVKQLLSEEQRRKGIAISLHYDSSPEHIPPIPRKASTPTVSEGREKKRSPLLLEKKSPMQLLNESLRAELREKDSLLTSMSEQLKSLQVEMSALKLHLSPVARYPYPPQQHMLYQSSPHAAGGVPGQFLSPSGAPMYQTSFGSSFNSSLVHQQSPMRIGMPSQMGTHYYASPQHHLTPLPPHLSPTPTLSGLGASVLSSQMFRGHPPQSSGTRPQQVVASGTGFATFPQQVPSIRSPSGYMFQSGGVVVSEDPLVTSGSGMVNKGTLEQAQYYQMQMRQYHQQQQQAQHQVLVSQPFQQQMLEQQQQLLQQQQQQQKKIPTPPTSDRGAPDLPLAASPLPSHPDPGFVLKPGTFLTASSQQQDLPVISSSPRSLATSLPSSSSDPPHRSPETLSVTTSGVSKMGSQPLTSTSTSTAASVFPSPFPTSLPLSGGFQFSMKPLLNQSPVSLNESFPPTSGTQPKGAETLAPLLQVSTVATSSSPMLSFAVTTSPFSLSTSITTSVLSTTSQPAMSTPSLSFYDTQTTTAATSTTTLNAGQKEASIFGTMSPSKEQEVKTEAGADRDTSFDTYPDFKPIVSLPEVSDIRTGEEDENVLFSHRAKLYRFDSEKSAWKERGIGDIKILKHKTSGKTRVLMRREQILKLCCNHYITAEMSLTPLQDENQLAWYTHCDFADGEAKAEKLAVKFKKAAVAGEFRKTFEECVTKPKDKHSSSSPTSQTATSLQERFSVPAGSWDCDTCLVQNTPTATKCVACGSDKPGIKGEAVAQPGSLNASLGDSLITRFSAPAGSWECDSCFVQNQSTSDRCVACGTSKQRLGTQPPTAGSTAATKTHFTNPVMFSSSTSIGENGGLKLGSFSLGVPPKSTAAPTTFSGGLKLGGLSLGTIPAQTSVATDPTSSAAAIPASSGGLTFSFGAQLQSSTETNAAEKPRFSFKLGDLSFDTPSATPTTVAGGGLSNPQPSTSTGFELGLSSQHKTSTAPKAEEKSSKEDSDGVLKLEPVSFTSASEAKERQTGLDFRSHFGTTASSSAESGKPFVFGCSFDVPKRPTVTAPDEEQNESHNSSAHEPDIHFDPIVTLPESVDIQSGEENEDVLFADRAKLFRFDSNLKQWKERGVGEMKLLANRSIGKARVLMRRDQILKICCNHFITREMTLTPMLGTNKAWTWFTLCDFADETEKAEKLAVRFKSPAIADTFKKAFEEAREYTGSTTSEEPEKATTAFAVESEKSGDKGDGGDEEDKDYKRREDSEENKAMKPSIFGVVTSSPKEDSWDCDSCYVTNQKDDKVCGACGQPQSFSHVSTSQPSQPFKSATQPMQQKIKFGAKLKLTPSVSVPPVVNREVSPERGSSSSSSPSPSPSPTHKQIGNFYLESPIRNDCDDDVVIVTVELPNEDKVELAEKYLLPPSFYNYEKQPPCPGCRGCIDLFEGPYEPSPPSKSEGTDSVGISRKEEDSMTNKEDGLSEQRPFAASHSDFSFSSLAANADDSGWLGQKTSGFSGFKGAGSQLFAVEPPGTEKDTDNPETEVDINFRPVVTLEAVEVKTGEEEEECLFTHRAKLYRFDAKLGQWKERGLGDIKILKNSSTQRSRIVMRREQVFKLCCNHFITPDMTLQANLSNEKSWTWKTLSDFTEQTAIEETFSIRFKHMKTVKQFAEVFRSCQKVHPTDDEPEEGLSPERQATPQHSETPSTTTNEAAKSSSPSSCNTLREMLAPALSPETEIVGSDGSEVTGGDVRALPQPQPPVPQTDTPSSPLSLPLVSPTPVSVNSPLSPRMCLPLIQPDAVTEEKESVVVEKDRPKSPPKPSAFGSGSSATASLSFAVLASGGSTSGFLSNEQKREGFQSSGEKLFSGDATGDEDPENEADIHFQPIISLPEAVVVKSWDEEADTLFCRRCKLYRFDQGQWKERGIGDLKIMKHRDTGKVKLIMRRDQILKLCCNHSLTVDMKVTQMATSEKACTWFTTADYSEEVVRPEKLSAKFKTAQILKEFMETFDKCKVDLLGITEGSGEVREELEGEGGKESKGEKSTDEVEEGGNGKESEGDRYTDDTVVTVHTEQVTNTD